MENTNEYFYSLTPDTILNAIESALDLVKKGNRATGRVFTLNSLENRVYEIELEEGKPLIAKFYRPGRWSLAQIQEEHDFLKELETNEIPVAAPMTLEWAEKPSIVVNPRSATLGEHAGIFFAVFPKIRGRILNELNSDQLIQVGRYLGRIHNIGGLKKAPHRNPFDLRTLGEQSLITLTGFSKQHLEPDALNTFQRYLEKAGQMVAEIRTNIGEKLTKSSIRIHGDCHLGNILWTDEGPTFLDFDDFVMGPPVQDLWLIVRGRDQQAIEDRDKVLFGYEQMRSFDRSSLAWIESLRVLRMVHYNGWISKRWEDAIFKQMFPGFCSQRFWHEELDALYRCTAPDEESLNH